MKKYLYTLLLAIFACTFITACDDDEDTEPTREELLTAKPWKGDRILVMGTDVENTAYKDYVPSPKSITVTLRKDKTYTLTYTQAGTPVSQDGTWELTNNEQEIKANFFNLSQEADIDMLTDDNFNFSNSVTVPGAPFPVKVEIRLVR